MNKITTTTKTYFFIEKSEISRIKFEEIPENFALVRILNSQSLLKSQIYELKRFLNNKCSEIVFYGDFAEEGHDLIDEYIESMELTNIVSTWIAKEEQDEDGYFYFKNLSGSNAKNLIHIFGDDQDEDKKIREYLITN